MKRTASAFIVRRRARRTTISGSAKRIQKQREFLVTYPTYFHFLNIILVFLCRQRIVRAWQSVLYT